MKKKLIILDRDGVINQDSEHYIKTPDEWRAIPGSLTAIKRLNDAGFIVTIATNQSGVNRGLLTLDTLHAIHAKMYQQLHDIDAHIDDLIFCPHAPSENCPCRKPKAGMMLTLMEKWKISPAHTWVIGDALRDVEAGQIAGCHVVLVLTGKGEKVIAHHRDELQGVPIYQDLAAAVDDLLKNNSALINQR